MHAHVSHGVTPFGVYVMDTAQILVTASGAVLVALVLLFFFGPRGRRR